MAVCGRGNNATPNLRKDSLEILPCKLIPQAAEDRSRTGLDLYLKAMPLLKAVKDQMITVAQVVSQILFTAGGAMAVHFSLKLFPLPSLAS